MQPSRLADKITKEPFVLPNVYIYNHCCLPRARWNNSKFKGHGLETKSGVSF